MIEIQDVSKQFDCVTALRHLTLKVQDGSVFGLVGSNGAGKSTLLRILAGVYRPDSGRVLINGQAPFENEQVKRSTVFISDYPYLAPTATVRRLAGLYRSVYPGWSEDYFARMEKLFPISFDARLGKMSKGMQRQAAILLGLSTQPRCILFDEIFDGLDPVVRELVKKLLVDFVAENGASVMIASHNLRELEDVCDHVGLLHRGGALCEDDLDRLKLWITRVQFALADPADFETVRSGLNLLKCSQQGKLFEMTVRGTETETLALVQRLHPLSEQTFHPHFPCNNTLYRPALWSAYRLRNRLHSHSFPAAHNSYSRSQCYPQQHRRHRSAPCKQQPKQYHKFSGTGFHCVTHKSSSCYRPVWVPTAGMSQIYWFPLCWKLPHTPARHRHSPVAGYRYRRRHSSA